MFLVNYYILRNYLYYICQFYICKLIFIIENKHQTIILAVKAKILKWHTYFQCFNIRPIQIIDDYLVDFSPRRVVLTSAIRCKNQIVRDDNFFIVILFI